LVWDDGEPTEVDLPGVDESLFDINSSGAAVGASLDPEGIRDPAVEARQQSDDSQTPRWPNSHPTDRDAVTPLSVTRPVSHRGRRSGRVSKCLSGRRLGSVHPDRLSCREGAGEQDERALAIGEATLGPTTRLWPVSVAISAACCRPSKRRLLKVRPLLSSADAASGPT
jgi:hypothetical protein